MTASLYLSLLRRVSLRHWRTAPGQTLLLIGILTLGVAVFVSVRLANRAAVSSFGNFAETLTGQSDWIIQAPAGSLSESVLREIRDALGSRPVHIVPVLETTAALATEANSADRFGRATYTVLGLDLIALGNLAGTSERLLRSPSEASSTGPGRAGATRVSPDAEGARVWLSSSFGDKVPASVDLVLDEQVRRLGVAGAIPSLPDAPPAPSTLMIMDLGQLQNLLGREGQLDRVEFLVEPGHGAAERRSELFRELVRIGGDGTRWNVTSPGARREAAETMTQAFRLNLTILSLIALVVGLYLIFQALDGAVVRRRGEIAILRSLGVEERAIRVLWLTESALLGLVGGVLGLLLGWAGAQAAVRAVGQTVNALYFATTVRSASLEPGEFGIGLSVGIVAAIVAGLWPASEAARTPPAQVLQRAAAPAAGSRYIRSLGLAVATLVVGVIAAQLPGLRLEGGNRFPLAGYAAAFLWIVSAGLFCGFLLPPLAWAGKSLGRRSVVFCLPLSHLRRPSGRHRLAAAALVCAIGMTAGMAVLVASFEETMQGWVRRTLHADLYLASSGAQSASSHNRISASAARRISEHPAVLRASLLLALPVDVRGLGTTLIGSDLGIRLNRPDTAWIAAPRDETIYDPAKNEGLALVTESLSERFRVRVGDRLTVPTPTGARDLRIAGIYAEYGNERGSILVERAHLQRWFQTDALTNLALFIRPGADADTVRADLLRQFPGLSIFTNAKLRSEILRIFRQTFSITYALEVIGVIVAVVGLGLTLISVLLDRRDELTTLRALGLNHQELARAGAVEGTAISVCAALAGIALSLGLGWLLIYVINKQSFGWTLGFVIPWGQLALLAAAVVVTGAVVSYWVGRWGAQLPADREE